MNIRIQPTLSSALTPPVATENKLVTVTDDMTIWIGDMQRGVNPLELSFPGEPDNMDVECKTDLLYMKLNRDGKIKDNLETFVKNQSDMNDNKLFLAIPGFIIAMISGGISDSYFEGTGLIVFFAIFIGVSVSLFLEITRKNKILERLNPLKNMLASERSWPSRIRATLNAAESRGMHLSTEMQAFSAVLKIWRYDSWWALVCMVDHAALSNLSRALEKQVEQLHRGAKLELGGDSSELIHRACTCIAPGYLDKLMDELETPPTVKI